MDYTILSFFFLSFYGESRRFSSKIWLHQNIFTTARCHSSTGSEDRYSLREKLVFDMLITFSLCEQIYNGFFPEG